MDQQFSFQADAHTIAIIYIQNYLLFIKHSYPFNKAYFWYTLDMNENSSTFFFFKDT